MRLTLPEELLRFVQDRVAVDGYASAGAYLRDLIAKAQREWERQVFEQELVDALRKGDFIEVTPTFWRDLRRKVADASR